MPQVGAPNHTPQNLCVARFRKIDDEAHGLRAQRPAEFFGNGISDLTRQCVGRLVTWPQHGEHDDRRACPPP